MNNYLCLRCFVLLDMTGGYRHCFTLYKVAHMVRKELEGGHHYAQFAGLGESIIPWRHPNKLLLFHILKISRCAGCTLNHLCPSRVVLQVVLQLFPWCLKTLLPERTGSRVTDFTTVLWHPSSLRQDLLESPSLWSWFVRKTYTRLPCRMEIHRELLQRSGQSEHMGMPGKG